MSIFTFIKGLFFNIEKEESVKQAVEDGKVELEKFDAELVTPEPVRARTKKGTFVADDPSTPDVNEAYVGGKAPKKKKTKRSKKKK